MRNGKNIFYIAEAAALLIVISAIILEAIFHFGDNVRNILDTVLFILLGLWGVFEGLAHLNSIKSLTLIVCGMYLGVFKFFSEGPMMDVIAVICILLLLVLIRPWQKMNKPANK